MCCNIIVPLWDFLSFSLLSLSRKKGTGKQAFGESSLSGLNIGFQLFFCLHLTLHSNFFRNQGVFNQLWFNQLITLHVCVGSQAAQSR